MADAATAQSPTTSASRAQINDTDEGAHSDPLGGLKAMPIDDVQTIGSLHTDDRFLRRVADRLLRAAYQSRYHVVVHDDEFLGTQDPPKKAAPIETESMSNENKVPAAKLIPSPRSISPIWYLVIPAISAFVLMLIVLRLLSKLRRRASSGRADNPGPSPSQKSAATKRPAARRKRR